ncbi:MAG: peptide methionine sulfoxide reductase [Cupriavidus sp.]|jgi:peptide-methionine (S)-S-oxide reductase|nr:MAG: peptide methionine sulfoxide reductase [Cupriavidus sp.]
MEKIGLGGGCHWCTEGVFQALKGVERVDQGFIRSDPPSDTWAEGVVVHFDPERIDLATLIEVHLRTHSASKTFIAEGKYRSAVYVFDERQRQQAIGTIAALDRDFERKVETRVLQFREFKASDERYQNYYAADPERPFCRRYIDPKLDFIRQNFAEHVSAAAHPVGRTREPCRSS